MIPQDNCEIVASVLFYLAIKITSYFIDIYRAMYNKRQPTLTSILERNENEEEVMSKKWVPKKKHEVLKAKYKCLKKLFQIYDASVMGILPEQCPYVEETDDRQNRSNRIRNNVCPETVDLSQTVSRTNSINESVATALITDLKMNRGSTITDSKSVITKYDKYANTRSIDNLTADKECECLPQIVQQHPIPYLIDNERRRPTRFQIFVQRLFGIRGDRIYRNYESGTEHVYAASDNNIVHTYWERRRRRGLRFRRQRKPKKIQSDGALRNVRNPVILSYVQSVQKSCLTDRTPRQCPILGCRMIFYGIINYNDHLNISHFPDRKYVCHYCHEGFDNESDKFLHENDHIGFNKLENNVSTSSRAKDSSKKASNTQTDPELNKCDLPEDKLKKIVSFFDKFGDPKKIVTEIKKCRQSDTNFHSSSSKTDVTETGNSSDSDKRTVSSVSRHRKSDPRRLTSSTESDVTSRNTFSNAVTCQFCGEHFEYRRQLSLHVDLEHRAHGKFSKFHSCAGIVNQRQPKRVDMVSEDGMIQVQSISRTYCGIPNTASSFSETSTIKSEGTVSCDPSTNIVYHTSTDSVKRASMVNTELQKVKNGVHYRWEPGTKIIHV